MSGVQQALSGDPPIGNWFASSNHPYQVTLEQAREMAKFAAQEGAAIALSEHRIKQKRGRSDQGSGSKKVGEINRLAREYEGYSVAELASVTGLHPTTIGKIESGQRGMSLQTFSKIGPVLGLEYVKDVVIEVGGWIPNDL